MLIADNAMRTCESEQRLVQSSTEELKTYERNKKGSKRAKREEIKKENACMESRTKTKITKSSIFLKVWF